MKPPTERALEGEPHDPMAHGELMRLVAEGKMSEIYERFRVLQADLAAAREATDGRGRNVMIRKPWADAATIRTVDNRDRRGYVLQLVLERDTLRAEVHRLRGLVMQLSQKVEDGEYSCHACSLSAGGICRPHVEVLHMRRQAMKETVRHESGGDT